MNPSCPRLGVVMLPAGAASRMGCSKAALLWRGKSFVGHTLDLACSVQPECIVVVQGAHPLADLIARAGHTGDCVLVHNDHWQDGPLTSLQLGLRTAGLKSRGREPLDGYIVLTVDRPRVQRATLAALILAFATAPQSIWQPRHGGVSGHPMIHPPDFARALLALAPHESPRTLLRDEHGPWPEHRRFMTTDDPGVLDNFDDPASLAGLD